MRATRSKRWCITKNLALDVSEPQVLQILSSIASELDSIEEPKLSFVLLGKERAPNTGRRHLQGYVETKTKMTMTTLLGVLPTSLVGSHVESAKGDQKSNIDYCSKEDVDPFTWGRPMKAGQRSDLEEIKKKIDNGSGMAELWDDHFSQMLQYRRGFAEYADSRAAKRNEMPDVYIFWGPTRTGKTFTAYEMAERLDQDTWSYDLPGWFDGYCNHKFVVFDEFDGSTLSFAMWKRLCDRYKCKVPIKGGSANWNPTTIVFTSNFDPKQWWADDNKPQDWWTQVESRVKEIRHMAIRMIVQ